MFHMDNATPQSLETVAVFKLAVRVRMRGCKASTAVFSILDPLAVLGSL